MSKFREQFQSLSDKGKKGLLNLNGTQAKYVTWGVYLVIAVVLFTMLNNNLPGNKSINSPADSAIVPQKPQVTTKSQTDIGLLEEEIESRLERTLSSIQGAGKVNVNVSLASGPIYEYATNVMTNIKDTKEEVNGGTREIGEKLEEGKLVITRGQGNNETPVIVKEIKPVVQGVLVVAEGASDPKVRMELGRAVEVALGVASYQVHVVPMER
jgi:stage III sporulation protein AG